MWSLADVFITDFNSLYFLWPFFRQLECLYSVAEREKPLVVFLWVSCRSMPKVFGLSNISDNNKKLMDAKISQMYVMYLFLMIKKKCL